jgi:general stress protein 26
MSENNEHPHETLWRLIKDIRFGMFTTRHDNGNGNGHLHSRPMTTQNKTLESDGSLWFFMSRKGDPVADIVTDDRVNIAYSDPGDDMYVSVSGEAKIVDDMAQKTALWNKFAEAWFPGGVTDPDLALVQVNIIHAHYWDVKSSKIVQLYEMAKSAFTGETPKLNTDTGEIRMRNS